MEIDPKTGLPTGAIEWEHLAKGSQHIKITIDKKRYGKIVTLASGFGREIDIKKTAKILKNELACGGTYREGEIELQGDHSKKIKPILVRMGFDENSIEG